MKVSVITVCYNSGKTIRRTMESVLSQIDVDLEYILIDGLSKDNTVDIIKEFANDNPVISWVSEKDFGIYDAMNKGIEKAKGDVVGILNSDDIFASNDVLKTVVEVFKKNKSLETCYGNLIYIKTNSLQNSFVPYRYWKSGRIRSFKFGWMPPHPTFFVKKSIYEKYGKFRLDCGTAADYELMLRFLEKNKVSTTWINKNMTYMEVGGVSSASIKSYKQSHYEDRNSWKKNGLKTPFCLGLLKKIRKLPQFVEAKFIKL